MTRYDRYESVSSMGYSVAYNPKGDGNCQFEALCYWLERLGIYRSVETLRDEIAEYLSQHPYNADWDPLEYFTGIPWDDYLETMAKNGEYEDHITLQAAAEILSMSCCFVPWS